MYLCSVREKVKVGVIVSVTVCVVWDDDLTSKTTFLVLFLLFRIKTRHKIGILCVCVCLCKILVSSNNLQNQVPDLYEISP